ncbi:MAG TPA: ECF-type sigma factor [Hyphomonas sp.]|nr:sigma-70 family RNA polymerase sigma factor [Hyphomonas sp.]MCA8904816.1 sigma-70 family RNA polymerase sigma factor [Hyphomonas sp.]MCB9972579.1 sigma-70 family RNA polymerase sigma factor [Hyphomonas sp.]HPE46832.1 ECF-type sigma factor [Hyphomonas sp.]
MADTQHTDPDDIRGLLAAWREGDEAARDRLFTLLYSELRQVSAALLRAERNSSLSTGDLVNEAVMRLIRLERIEWNDKTHFLALAARAMRRILIDNARRKASDKRQHHKVTLVTRIAGAGADRIDFDILEKALIRLAAIDKAKADIVELRYFAGMSHQEIAEVTGTSEATVKRGWRAARAWLLDALEADKQVRDTPA